jgi:hypothetical protein
MTHHILLSQVRDSPNLEGQAPVFISPRKGWPGYPSRHWVPFSSPLTTLRATVEVFDPASTRSNCLFFLSLESYITTDSQLASLSWNKAPIWGLRPDFYFCLTVAGLLMFGAVSDERTGLSFTIAAGPRQRSHSRVWVPWESWSYYTVSDSRLPFLSPPTTRRVTVEVFDPASTRESFCLFFLRLSSLCPFARTE